QTGEIPPQADQFSGFIFKIQANMDPSHRDCVAFMRICSGKFERDMTVKHPRTGKTLRLSHAHKLFAKERETSNEGFAGDIIGFSSNQGVLGIGDTVCTGKSLQFEAVPKFPPELFASLRNPNPSKYKQFTKGIQQLAQEGAIQVFHLYDGGGQKGNMVLAAVGQLQFEVIQHRLKSEYTVDTVLDPLPEYTHARWLKEQDLEGLEWITNARRAEDDTGRPMVMFRGEWSMNYMMEKNPDVEFLTVAPN
nr:peptide chain release factor 3 [Vampirovibrio sp.]